MAWRHAHACVCVRGGGDAWEACSDIDTRTPDAGMPCGARGALCMQIQKPRGTDDYTAFIGRKGLTQSMQAITDHKRRFVDISVGWPGCWADITIWKFSSFFKKAVNNEVLIGSVVVPDPRDKRRTMQFQEYIIGDGGYTPCTPYLVVPYRGKVCGLCLHATRRAARGASRHGALGAAWRATLGAAWIAAWGAARLSI